jgi:hypothetical protein
MSINWQDVFITIGSTVGGGGVILGAAAWLIKTALTTKLTQDTEAFKARLQTEGNAEIEKLKHSLEKIAVEHQVRFASFHERRAEIIAELDGYLLEIEQFVLRFASERAGSSDRMERYELFKKNLECLYYFVEKNRIYLPEHVCEILEVFIPTYEEVLFIKRNHYFVKELSEIEGKTGFFDQQGGIILEIAVAFSGKIPEVRAVLEKEFRTILGG